MKFSTAITAASVLLAGCASSTPLNLTTSNPQKYVRAPIFREAEFAGNAQYGYYWINLGFGKPPYMATVIVDSGSGDLWVKDQPGGYQANSSTTFQPINSSFSVSYDSGAGETGNWGTEYVTLPGGLTAKNMVFGDVTSANAGPGFMGVSLRGGGLQAGDDPPAMLAGLVADNITNTMAYSLYLSPASLDHPSTANSQIIFGGIDPSLYIGSLIEFETYESTLNADYYDDFFFAQLTRIAVDNRATGETSDIPIYIPVLIDSGTEQILLPSPQANEIAAIANATYHEDPDVLANNYFTCQCSNIPADATVNFTFFDALDVAVPLSAMVNNDTEVEGQCIIPIGYETHPGGSILGAEFLRFAYVIFDVDNQRLAMAQAADDPTNGPVAPDPVVSQHVAFRKRVTSITTIPPGTGPLPGATSVTPAPNTTANGVTTTTSTQPSTTGSGGNQTFNGNSTSPGAVATVNQTITVTTDGFTTEVVTTIINGTFTTATVTQDITEVSTVTVTPGQNIRTATDVNGVGSGNPTGDVDAGARSHAASSRSPTDSIDAGARSHAPRSGSRVPAHPSQSGRLAPESHRLEPYQSYSPGGVDINIDISQEIEVSWSGGSGSDPDWNPWGPENEVDAEQWEQWCDYASTYDPDTCIVAVTAIQWVYISGESTSTCSDLDQRTTYFRIFVVH